VGGGLDETPAPGAPTIPRWEYFIGDRPHAKEYDADNKRQPIAQIAAVEHHAGAQEVILSSEVMEHVADQCEIQVGTEDYCSLVISASVSTRAGPWSGSRADPN
jgi:hypothetical protein